MGVSAQRLLEGFDRPLIMALLAKYLAQVVPGHCVLGIETQRLLVGLDVLGRLSEGAIDLAQAVPG